MLEPWNNFAFQQLPVDIRQRTDLVLDSKKMTSNLWFLIEVAPLGPNRGFILASIIRN